MATDLTMLAETDVQSVEQRGQHSGPGRILVIEDDETLRDVMETLISIEGCEPRSAADGAGALEIIPLWQPDLILLDLYMPGMDGTAFLKAYREVPEPRAPVILLSGSTQPSETFTELGVAGILPKPFNVNELLEMVAQFTDCSHG